MTGSIDYAAVNDAAYYAARDKLRLMGSAEVLDVRLVALEMDDDLVYQAAHDELRHREVVA